LTKIDPEGAMERYTQRQRPDEASMRARRRRSTIALVVGLFVVASIFCCFISGLIGVPQSFIGQWWMKPPRYPGAVEVDFREGQVCLMQSPGEYCYEWFYRTPDSEGQVIDYYRRLEWPLHSPITFEWRRGRRFGLAWVAESCIGITSNVSCYQIIVHPSGEGDTEVYILERGAIGAIAQGDQ
jgi:hypothetical protein